MIQDIKNKLIKVFSLEQVSENGQELFLEFSYQHFIYFDHNKINIKLNGSAIQVSVTKHRRRIKISIPMEEIEPLILNSSFNLKVSYGSQELWITPEVENEQKLYQSVQVASNVYEVVAAKQLVFKRIALEYPVVESLVSIGAVIGGQNKITLTDCPPSFESVVVANASKQVKFNIADYPIIDLSAFMIGGRTNALYLFGYSEQKAYRFILPEEVYDLPSARVQVIGNRLRIKMRHQVVKNMIIKESIDNKNVELIIEDGEFVDTYEVTAVTLADSEGETDHVTDIKTMTDRTVITIPVALLAAKRMKKTFIFTLLNKETQETFDTRIKSRKQNKFTKYLYVENQLLELYFIQKQGVAIKYKSPNLKAGINSLTKDSIDLYFRPSPVYAHGRYVLRFEERASQAGIELPIHFGRQVIDVDFNQLEDIRSSAKNVIDIFVCIYDGETILRKDKLRYRLPDYKKDDYLEKTDLIHDDSQITYLFTLTPYKNLKIESFKLSNEEVDILSRGKKDNNVWLIGERTETAQDNGVSFFRWLKKHSSVEAYYVIDGESKDYQRVKDEKNVVMFDSKEHFEVAARANVLISTHDLENILPYKTARGFFGYEDTVKIFLQHGVLGRKNVEYHKANYNLPFDLFNVSSHAEKYDIVMKQFGYDEEEVAITGLSRFDNLPLVPNDEVKRILIMPTWRDFLNNDFSFINSDYMARYVSLLNSDRLKALAEKESLEINFYPHFRAQEFFKNSLEDTGSLVKFVELGDRTVQELLIENDVLITDYSSVSFDFSYMNKPVLFYHFDAERFFRKGILRPISETFIGDIANTEDALIDNLEKALKKDKPVIKFDGIFDHIDHHNNERVYAAISEKVFKSE